MIIRDPMFAEVGTPNIAIIMIKSEAEEVSHALSDLLCWLRGWHAAATDAALHNGPYGVEAARELNILLKSALREAERPKV
jgi:hypothetical protein